MRAILCASQQDLTTDSDGVKRLLGLFFISLVAYSQQVVNGNRQFLGHLNATTATETQPFKAGVLADRPATCSIADTYFATDGTPGSNIYICTSANTWTQITGGGSGTVTNVSVTSVPNWLSASFANPTSTPALTIAAASGQTSHEVIGTCGTTSSFGPCALTVGDLPNGYPYSSLSGIPTLAASASKVAHEWLDSYNAATGAFTQSQPEYSDISGTPTLYNQTIEQGGTAQTQRPNLNLLSGSNMTISCVDNSGAGSTDCTFAASSTGATAFSALTSSTNTQAAMVIGTGASLNVSGTGTNNATSIGGVTVTGTPASGDVPVATSATAATWQAQSGGSGWTIGTLANMPPTCTAGAGYFATDQPANQQLYTCSAANTWTESLTLGLSGALKVAAGALDINTDIVPQKGTPNIFTALDTFQAGLNLNTTNTQPDCTSSTRGDIWFANGGSSADSLETCEYNGSAYAWTSGGGSSGITALTGDVTASGSGSVAATLATVNSGPGQCGDATHVCQVTTNGKGLVTSQQAVAISGTGGAATSLVDANGESVITTSTAVSPVNYLTAGNAATGSPVTLTAAGSDANISINLIPKGTGTVECNGATCGGGFTGTAGSVPFVSSAGTLTQDNANFFWDDTHHVLSVATNNNSGLISHMDTGIELYANGSNYGRGGLFLTGQAGGGYAFSNSSYNSNFCFSSNNFTSCLIAVNPSISSTNLYFDATNSEGANAAFSILAGSEGGHIYTHGTAPTISGTNCYAGKVAAIIGSATVTNGSESITVGLTTGVATGQVVGDDAGDIPQGATVTAVSGTTITISVTATGSSTTDNLTFIDTTSASNDDDGFVATVASATPRSCTVTFATPWTATQSGPVCTASSSIGNPGVSATQTSLTLSQSSSSASSMAYRCTGTN